MKKFKFISILLFFGVFLGCQNQKEQENTIEKEFPEQDSVSVKENISQCYLFENGKDSIQLKFDLHENEVKGWMVYNFFEKDGSFGEIDGEFSGDTLKLEYAFLSEGMLSEQEVYFLKKGNQLFRGFGEMKMDVDSTMVYIQPNQISFEDTTPLTSMANCAEDFIDPKTIAFFKKEEEKN